MTSSALLAGLLQASAWLAIALAAPLLLRALLRRLLGPGIAYAAWLLAPVMIVAALLPAAASSPLQVHANWDGLSAAAPVMTAAPGANAATCIVALWCTGMLLYALMLRRRHAAFMRALGPLRRHLALACAPGLTAGAMVLGWRHPRIVVPADFRQRYSARQRRLLIAHERVHLRRGDLFVNLLLAMLQSVFWFHPLLHLAAERLRRDQELACDDVVLRRFRNSRQAYGYLLLDAHGAPRTSPLACQWQSPHPLEERIMQLTRRSALPRFAGQLLLTVLVSCIGVAAWAVQPPPTATYDIALTLQADGATATPRLRVRNGEPFAVAIGEGAARWHVASVLAVDEQDGSADVTLALRHGTQPVGAPRLRIKLGETAGVKVDGAFGLSLTVTRSAP